MDELFRRGVELSQTITARFSNILDLLYLCPAPVIFELRDVPLPALRTESGADPTERFSYVNEVVRKWAEQAPLILQQENFRLQKAFPVAALKCWLVAVTKWNPYQPEAKLFALTVA